MSIYGGLKAAAALLVDRAVVGDMIAVNKAILAGIEGSFVPDQGYCYGYVTYHDDLVMKYDTPQYFGLMPEAFSADNPEQCYINPLVWACVEVVSAFHVVECGP